jgi:hypothetical protein
MTKPLPTSVKVAVGVTTIFALVFGIRSALKADLWGAVFGAVFLVVAFLLWKGYSIGLRLGSVAGGILVAIGLFGGWSLTAALIWVVAGVAFLALLWTRGARHYFLGRRPAGDGPCGPDDCR